MRWSIPASRSINKEVEPMDNNSNDSLSKAVAAEGPSPADLSPDQVTGQFVNVPAEQLAETEMAGFDAMRQPEEPEHLEDRVKTLSPGSG